MNAETTAANNALKGCFATCTQALRLATIRRAPGPNGGQAAGRWAASVDAKYKYNVAYEKPGMLFERLSAEG